LGYAVAALGMGGYVAGVFHLVTSIFSTALLLLAVVSVGRGVSSGLETGMGHDPDELFDVFRLGGLRARQPVAFGTFLVGALGLAGLPFVTAGFWSRDAVLAQAWAGSRVSFWLLVVAGGAAAFGAMRLFSLIFLGAPRSRYASRASRGRVSAFALIVLAGLVVVWGWIGIPEQIPLVGGSWLASFLGVKGGAGELAWEPTLLGIIFGTSGLLFGYVVYTWRPVQAGEADPIEAAMHKVGLGWLYGWGRDRSYVERIYRRALAGGSLWLAGALASFDGLLARVADGAGRLGRAVSRVAGLVDARALDGTVNGAGRVGVWVSGALNLFDTALGVLSDWAGAGALALARFGGVADSRVLGRAVDGAGGAVSVAGAWLRPRTGKVQSYLMLALVAILVLVATFVFLFR
jgi:NADH-quinone oxidoreductase subunit L